MATTAAKVLDRTRFEARARVGDLLALGLLVVVGFSLMVDMYALGHSASQAAGDAGVVFQRDATFVRMLVQAGVVAIATSWIAYRLLSASARRLGGGVAQRVHVDHEGESDDDQEPEREEVADAGARLEAGA
ncbi:MAG TPA: hypothetical protein VHH36_00475, partial [Candidatus Thermoplasmatota archaeon]|nr:hypothetical protein [Candidatus Thermoplasmatota archaeon]